MSDDELALATTGGIERCKEGGLGDEGDEVRGKSKAVMTARDKPQPIWMNAESGTPGEQV